MDPKPCTKCGTETTLLDRFPEGLCLACHARKVENEPMPTARQLAQMWGGK